MTYKQKRLKIYWTLFWILLWILGIYIAITKSYKNSSIWIYTSIALHFLSLISIYIIWDKDNIYRLRNIKLSFPEILERVVFTILGLIYLYLLISFSSQYESNQLKKYGVKTQSVVVLRYQDNPFMSRQLDNFVKIKYTYSNKIYYQSFRDSDTAYNVGNTVTILISTKDPMLFEVLD